MKPGAKPIADWTMQQIAQVESIAGFGLNNEQVGAFFGYTESGFRNAHLKLPALREAMNAGRAKAAARVTQTAYELATSGKCPAMTMFWCKTRLGWREVDRTEHTGPGGGPVEHKLRIEFVKTGGDGKQG